MIRWTDPEWVTWAARMVRDAFLEGVDHSSERLQVVFSAMTFPRPAAERALVAAAVVRMLEVRP